jgi:plastocyanin
MKKQWIVAVAVFALVLVGVGAWALTKDDGAETSTTSQSSASSTSPSDTSTPQNENGQQNTTEENAPTDVVITYTDDGFTPASVTVKAGTPITVKNESTKVLEFASDDHPDHTDNSELNIGDVPQGSSKTLIINTTGTWGYHNHEHDDDSGRIVVEQ